MNRRLIERNNDPQSQCPSRPSNNKYIIHNKKMQRQRYKNYDMMASCLDSLHSNKQKGNNSGSRNVVYACVCSCLHFAGRMKSDLGSSFEHHHVIAEINRRLTASKRIVCILYFTINIERHHTQVQ